MPKSMGLVFDSLLDSFLDIAYAPTVHQTSDLFLLPFFGSHVYLDHESSNFLSNCPTLSHVLTSQPRPFSVKIRTKLTAYSSSICLNPFFPSFYPSSPNHQPQTYRGLKEEKKKSQYKNLHPCNTVDVYK